MTSHALFPSSSSVISNYFGISAAAAIVMLAIVGVWALVWKGFALWKASKRNQLGWFIALLIINTAGILEILYIFVFSELGRRPRVKKSIDRKPMDKKLLKLKKK